MSSYDWKKNKDKMVSVNRNEFDELKDREWNSVDDDIANQNSMVD